MWWWIWLAQSEIGWDALRPAERIGMAGHVSDLPPEIRKLEGQWVFAQGHVLTQLVDNGTKVWLAEEMWFEREQFGTPRTPFNSIRLAFRPGSVPPDIESYESLRVSGRFRVLREVVGGRIQDLFWIVDAVEGRRPEPPESPIPEASPGAPQILSYSQLARGAQEFHGRWVTLSGNVLATTGDGEMRRFLIAKNPWDGCCMGVPPTAHDSVSVTMKTRLGNPFARTATVSGLFVVAPKEIHGELAELYFLRDAVEGTVVGEPSDAFPLNWVLLALFGVLIVGSHLWLRRPRRGAQQSP
jgi:hypothetical protein